MSSFHSLTRNCALVAQGLIGSYELRSYIWCYIVCKLSNEMLGPAQERNGKIWDLIWRKIVRPRVSDLFSQTDTDRDGLISRTEYRSVVGY